MDKGIELIIATGRDINMVKDFIGKYDLHCDLILNNGTQFMNKERTINEIHPMKEDAFIKIAHILFDYGYLLAIHTDQGKYSLVDKEEFWKYHVDILTKSLGDIEKLPKKTFTTRDYLRDLHYAKTPEEIVLQGVNVLKIDARHLDAYSIRGVKESLNIEGLEFSSSFEDNIEITSDEYNKGIMLEKLIKSKGYTYDEVAVFGDGVNDVRMLEKFHYSFAPENAGEAAKKTATYQMQKSNETGAVGEGIELLERNHLI